MIYMLPGLVMNRNWKAKCNAFLRPLIDGTFDSLIAEPARIGCNTYHQVLMICHKSLKSSGWQATRLILSLTGTLPLSLRHENEGLGSGLRLHVQTRDFTLLHVSFYGGSIRCMKLEVCGP